MTSNVAIALASYFSDHLDRPEDDEEGEDGWGVWVIEQTNVEFSEDAPLFGAASAGTQGYASGGEE